MDRKVLFTVAATTVATIILFSVLVLPSDAERQAIEYNLDKYNFDKEVTFNVQTGDTLKITGTVNEGTYVGLDAEAIGKIPGITVSGFAEAPDGQHFYKAEGTFTTPGTYKLDTKCDTGMIQWGNDPITINVTLSYHTVKFVAGEGGTVDTESVSDIPYGTPISADGNTLTINGTDVAAKADEGYEFVRWDNADGTITADRTVTAVFKPIVPIVTYKATINAGEGGNVDRTSIEGLSYGTTVSVKGSTLSIGGTPVYATADEGYKFKEWKNVPSEITSDVTITAVFEKIPGPEPTPSDDGKNLVFLIISIVSAVAAIILLGAALYGVRHPLVYVMFTVAAALAVIMMLFYVGIFKI